MNQNSPAASESRQRRFMVEAAKQAAIDAGFQLLRVPGRGMSNVWMVTKDGKTAKASIRTSRDRHIAFPPLDKGKRWKTLDDVELVFLASMDDKDNPQLVEVYLFPATEVRKRFDSAYTARTKAGQTHPDNFGMWIPIDQDKRGIPSSVGCGLASDFKAIATYSIASLLAGEAERRLPYDSKANLDDLAEDQQPAMHSGMPSLTIKDVLAKAREQIAEIAGVKVGSVKLDLELDFDR